MIVIKEYEELKNIISNHLTDTKNSIISVDGVDGCGKSTLSSRIAQDFPNIIHINLDDENFLEQNKGGYINYIKYDFLKNTISDLIKNNNIILIDGICILEILNQINLKSSLKIYVKKLVKPEFWLDGTDFDYSKNLEEVIKQKEEELKKFEFFIANEEKREPRDTDFSTTIEFEILQYHFKYRPDLNSDIVFERIDN